MSRNFSSAEVVIGALRANIGVMVSGEGRKLEMLTSV